MSPITSRTLTPAVPITSPDFVYTKAAQTDVTQIWLKHGWVPPNKQHQQQQREVLNKPV